MSEMTDALMRLADSIDATGDGVEGWETSDAHAWAEQVRDAAELDPYAGTPCGRHLGAVARCIAMLEAMGRKHGAELEGLRAERDALRNELARLNGQTHGYPTEKELSPEMRARLMPEGMEWPRFEDGEPVMPLDTINVDGYVEFKVIKLGFCELGISFEGRRLKYFGEYGERVKRPEPPATVSQSCRDSVAQDSWERLGHDIERYGIGYASTLPDEADRERDALVARAKALAAGPDVVRPGEVV